MLLTGFALSSQAGGGVQIKLELTLGNQDTAARISVFGFGAASKGKTAVEAGLSFWGQYQLRRYGAAHNGWAGGYEAFALVGHGRNDNLLGSVVGQLGTNGFSDPDHRGDFFGLGFGIRDDQIAGSLAKFGVRQGSVILRAASADRSLHLNFSNDFRIGPVYGQATDFGPTSRVRLGYAKVLGRRLDRYGLAFDIFTPQQDFKRAPSNPENSGDGRKRSWYTTEPWGALFHANLYVSAARSTDDSTWSAKLGTDSPRLGAYLQNRIHDGFGLYPRFPWPTAVPNRPYVELTGARLKNL